MLRSFLGIVNHSNNSRILSLHQSIPSNKILPTLSTITKHINAPLRTDLHNKTLRRTTRSLLSQLSNNNITGLLSTVLTEEEQISLDKVKPVFDSVHNYLETNAIKEQGKIKSLQFISPHISFDSLKNIGFKTEHQESHKAAIKQWKSNGNKIQLKSKTQKRGRKSMINDPLIQRHVYKFCIKHSEYQHERILKRKSRKENRTIFAKRLKQSKKRLWGKYKKSNINIYNIGKTVFYKIIKQIGEFKNPKKRTDLCNVCVAAKQAKK
eukprot:227825_1